MFFKLGVKSLLRQPGKTISFFLLLLFVTLFLVLSVSMRVSSEGLLDDADERFLTVATIDYKGESYPDDRRYDETLEKLQQSDEYAALSNADGVKHFEHYLKLRGYIGDYPVKVDKQYMDLTVILFKVNDDTGMPTDCMLLKEYSTHNDFVEGGYFELDLSEFGIDSNASDYLKVGHKYIAFGEYVSSNGSSVFTPRFFSTHQLELTDLQTDALLRTTKGKPSRTPYKFFLTDGILQKASEGKTDSMQDFYSGIFDNSNVKNGPFIDVTNNPNVYSKCVYDEEWLAKQPELWKSLAQSLDDTNIDWKSLLYAVTKSYEVMSNSTDVIMTDNIEYEPLFHQHIVQLIDGSYYTQADGSNVCVVSSVLANTLKLTVGDTLHIDLHNAAAGDEHYNSYFYGSGFKHSGDYVIKGIYKLTDDIQDSIFIPIQKSETHASTLLSEPTLPDFTNSYRLGTFVLNNSTASTFAQNIKGSLPSKCSVTVYDQGYINVAAPLESMSETSLLLIAICAFTGICIIMLFAYIFVSKQASTAKTMLNLGTGGGNTLAYLMYGVMILVVAACFVGAIVGYFASDTVLTYAYKWAADNSIVDLSYSTMRTSLKNKPFNLDFTRNTAVIAITCATVITLSLLICFIFANKIILSKNKASQLKKKKKKKPARMENSNPAHTTVRDTSAIEQFTTISSEPSTRNPLRSRAFIIKHSVRSIARTPGRSIIVPFVSLAIIILMSVFCGLLQTYERSIDNLYKTIPVEGQFLTLNGTSNDGLLLEKPMLLELLDNGYIDDVDYSYSEIRFKLLGYYENDKDGDLADFVTKLEVNEEFDGFDEFIPPGAFSAERFLGKLWDRSQLVFTTSMDNAPEFYGSGVQKIEYAKGYDSSLFLGDEAVCVVPRKLLSEYEGLSMGSTIRLGLSVRSIDGSYMLESANLRIVGITDDVTGKIYAPINAPVGIYKMFMDNQAETASVQRDTATDDITDDTNLSLSVKEIKKNAISNHTRLNAFNFTLKNGYDVAPLKSYLTEKGFSYPAHIGIMRRCLTVDDSELQNTVNSLTKVKSYLEILYPVIYVIIIAIAFVVSYLLVRTRTTDIAIMRSSGSGKTGTFFALFTEQFVLACVGVGLAALAVLPIYKSLTQLQMISIALYVLCYTIGLIIAICAINAVNVLKILSSKD